MCRHQTLTVLPKHCAAKINQGPCTIWYTPKMTTFHKGTTVDKTNLQTGEIIHMDFAFYNVTSTPVFIYILPVVCENTIMLWLFPTAYKRAHVHIIRFILTTLNNEQHTCRHVIVKEYGALVNSTDLPTLLSITSEFPWRLLVVRHHASMEIMKDTTE